MFKIAPIFMFFVLLTAPLFPGRDTFGFYSVEWSFYFLSLFLFFGFLLIIFKRDCILVWDRFYIFLILFLFFHLFSMIDAPNRWRCVLYSAQYLPMFLLCIVTISTITREDNLHKFITIISWLCVLFNIIVIIAAIYYYNRVLLNGFLLDYFNISVNKILTFIELPLCISLLRTIIGEKENYDIILLTTGFLAISLSGSRGSFLTLFILLGITFLKSHSKMKSIIIIGFVGIIFGIVLISTPYTSERIGKLLITNESDYQENISSYSRIYSAIVAVKVMIDHPFNGIGIGNLSNYSEEAVKGCDLPPKIIAYWNKKHLFETTATSLLLGAELGLMGFILFIAIYFHLWRRISLLKKQDNKYKFLLRAMELYIIIAFIHNFMDRGFTNYYTWLYLGIIISAIKIDEKNLSYKYFIKRPLCVHRRIKNIIPISLPPP